MKKGILGLLVVAFSLTVASTALAAPSARGLEMRAAHSQAGVKGIQGEDGLAVDDGVIK